MPELSMNEWFELLKPFGYADIISKYPCTPRGFSVGKVAAHEIRLMLVPSGTNIIDEWLARLDLLGQAAGAVRVVREKGFILASPPRISFAGSYVHESFGYKGEPVWRAEAELEMEVFPK